MKKFALFILFCLFSANSYAAPVFQKSNTFGANGNSDCYDLRSLGAKYHTLRWNIEGGTLSAGTVKLAKYTNSVCTTGSTDIIAATTATSNGEVNNTSSIGSYVMLTFASYAGSGGKVNVWYGAYVDASIVTNSDGSIYVVSSAVTSTKRYISVGSTEDESEVCAVACTLISLSAWNAHATADAFFKCTNATAANTIPGSTAVAYSMIVPHDSGFVESAINWPFTTAMTCYLVLSKEDTAADEVAANTVSYNLRYR